MSTEAHRRLMEQFGDIPGITPPQEPQQAEPAQPAQPLTAQEKLLQEMPDALISDMPMDKFAQLEKVEVVDANGRSYTVTLDSKEQVSYSFVDNNKTLRITIY